MLFPYTTRLSHNLPYMQKFVISFYTTIVQTVSQAMHKSPVPFNPKEMQTAVLTITVTSKKDELSNCAFAGNMHKVMIDLLPQVKEQYPDFTVTGNVLDHSASTQYKTTLVGETGHEITGN